MLPLFLIIRAPPEPIEFPERFVDDATQGCDDDTPDSGKHRAVLVRVWAPGSLRE